MYIHVHVVVLATCVALETVQAAAILVTGAWADTLWWNARIARNEVIDRI